MRSIKEWNINNRKYTLLHHNMKYQLRIDDQYSTLLLKLGDIDPDAITTIEMDTTDEAMQSAVVNAIRGANQCRAELMDIMMDSDEIEDIKII